nr:unnamed protein product [Spirometra erinaceieuropaei]
MDIFIAACDDSDLTTNTEKKVLMDMPPPNAAYNDRTSMSTAPRCKPWTPSPTRAAPSLAAPKSMTKWPPDLQSVSEHFGHESVALDVSGPSAAPRRHQLMPSRLPVLRPPCRKIALRCFRLPSSSSTTIPASIYIATAPAPTTNEDNFEVPSNLNLIAANTNDEDSAPTFSHCHCHCTFTSHIGLVGHLLIYGTETDKLVPGAPPGSLCSNYTFPRQHLRHTSTSPTTTQRKYAYAARLSSVTLVTWNARLLSDSPMANRPEGMTVLVASYLTLYIKDIAVLNETCLSKHGQLKEVEVGYTFWSGHPRRSDKSAESPSPSGAT